MNALNKEILRLAIPSILANITVPIVGMVDIAVAGHLHGSGVLLGQRVGDADKIRCGLEPCGGEYGAI